MEKTYLTTKELAFRWNMSEITLIQWRWNGCGPLFHKMGRKVNYKLEEIEAYEKLIIQNNTAQIKEIVLSKIMADSALTKREEASNEAIAKKNKKKSKKHL